VTTKLATYGVARALTNRRGATLSRPQADVNLSGMSLFGHVVQARGISLRADGLRDLLSLSFILRLREQVNPGLIVNQDVILGRFELCEFAKKIVT
jgi:hypothetical protein